MLCFFLHSVIFTSCHLITNTLSHSLARVSSVQTHTHTHLGETAGFNDKQGSALGTYSGKVHAVHLVIHSARVFPNLLNLKDPPPLPSQAQLRAISLLHNTQRDWKRTNCKEECSRTKSKFRCRNTDQKLDDHQPEVMMS